MKMNLDEKQKLEIICNILPQNYLIHLSVKCFTKFIEIKKHISKQCNMPINYIFLYNKNDTLILDNDFVIDNKFIEVKFKENINNINKENELDENLNLQTLLEENKEENEYELLNKKKNRENIINIDENGKLKSNFDPYLENLQNIFNKCFNEEQNYFDIDKFTEESGKNIYNFEDFINFCYDLLNYEKNKNKKKNYFKKKIFLKRHKWKNNKRKKIKKNKHKNFINKKENIDINNIENKSKNKIENIDENIVENINIVYNTDNKIIKNDNLDIYKSDLFIVNKKINNFSIEKINDYFINNNYDRNNNNNNNINIFNKSDNSLNKNNIFIKSNKGIENNNNYNDSSDDFFFEENKKKNLEKNNKEEIENNNINLSYNIINDYNEKTEIENKNINKFFLYIIDKTNLNKEDIKKLKYYINYINEKLFNRINHNKKINFIFDVDNTLIHFVQNNIAGYKHLIFKESNFIYSYEIRNYAIEFIKNISKFCKIHINSLGLSIYISKVVNEFKKDYNIHFETVTARNETIKEEKKYLNNYWKNNTIIFDDSINVWENDKNNVISSKIFLIKNYYKQSKITCIFFNFLNESDWKDDNFNTFENNELIDILIKEYWDSIELQLKYLEKNVEIIYKLFNYYNIPCYYSIKLIRLCVFSGFCFNIQFLDKLINKNLIIHIIKTCGGDYYEPCKNNYKEITHVIYNDIQINKKYNNQNNIKKQIKNFVMIFEKKIKIVNLKYIFDSYYFMTNLNEDNILYKVDL